MERHFEGGEHKRERGRFSDEKFFFQKREKNLKNPEKILDKFYEMRYYIQALVCECFGLWPSSSVG